MAGQARVLLLRKSTSEWVMAHLQIVQLSSKVVLVQPQLRHMKESFAFMLLSYRVIQSRQSIDFIEECDNS